MVSRSPLADECRSTPVELFAIIEVLDHGAGPVKVNRLKSDKTGRDSDRRLAHIAYRGELPMPDSAGRASRLRQALKTLP